MNCTRRLAAILTNVLGLVVAASHTAAPAGAAPSPGRALAEKYCTACHLLPEPALLTKTAWSHHIQPEMAKWLGLERVDYEGMADGRLIEQAKLYPGTPILSESDWFTLWDYYRDAAPGVPVPQPPKPPTQPALRGFRVHKLNPLPGAPTISMTRIDSANRRLVVADSFASVLVTMDMSGTILDRDRYTSPPIGLAQGQRRSYLTLIGRLFPSDSPEGALLSLPEGGRGTPRPLLENLRRPTDAIAADLNQDGREDLVVCQFGNRLGQFSWFENRGDGRFEEHVLLDRPGALAARAIDLTRDGLPDLVVLTGQAREALHLFINQGKGSFRLMTPIEKPPSWGFAAFDLVDFNRDGFVDVLTANGDNGDFALPLKAYHGVRLYLNDGRNNFDEAFFYPMHGAYKALGRDFDGDGDLDIAAIAYYPDFEETPPAGFIWLENQGGLKFIPQTCPEAALGRWMTMDAGDVDGDGDEDLALGSFVKGPTTLPVPISLREQWRTNGAAILLLENLRPAR